MEREEKLRRQKEFLIKAAYWAVWAAAAIFLIKYAGPVLFPFAAAFLVAWLLSGPVEYVTEKIHLKRSFAAVGAVILFYALVGITVYFIGSAFARLLGDVFAELPEFLSGTVYPMLERFFSWMDGTIARLRPAEGTVVAMEGGPVNVMEKAGELASGFSGDMMSWISGVAACIPGFCMKILIAVIATLFMELEFPGIRKFLKNQIPEKWQKSVADGKNAVLGTFGKCILSYAFIMLVTFAELTAGLLLLGINGAVVIALIIAVLDILPVLGTGTVLIPWTLIALATGDVRTGVGILGIYLIITVVRNIMEPKLVGRQMGLSPVVMLPAMLLGLRFFGLIGLIVMPFALSFLKNLNDKGILRGFREEQPKQL